MRILFIANSYLNLYKPIEDELKRRGHVVHTIFDRGFKFDPFYHTKLSSIKSNRFLWAMLSRKYWKEKIKNDRMLSDPFDMLFVLGGCSICEFIIDYLQSLNPTIKKVLYVWDGCEYYAFDRLIPFMDKSYTFDIGDVKKDNRWRLLPIYFKIDELDFRVGKMEYDLFVVGTNHYFRYSFLKRLLPQIKDAGLNCFIKLYSGYYTVPFLKRIYHYLFLRKNAIEIQEEISFSQGKENTELLTREPIAVDVYMNVLSKSKCVIDHQSWNQKGLTARFMWALGAHKKIITTNKWVYEYPFISRQQVSVINLKEPILPVDFIKDELKKDEESDVSLFRIDRWVDEILS